MLLRAIAASGAGAREISPEVSEARERSTGSILAVRSKSEGDSIARIEVASVEDEDRAGISAGTAARAVSTVTALFAVTVFTSAFLLFALEPMFSKMLLPIFGGSPAVWNT